MTVLAAIVYLNALANGLVWDDPIVLDRQLLAFKSVRDVIFIPRNIPQFSPDYYRPLTTLTYLIDRQLGGTGPFMFHLSVVVFHVVTTFLVYCLGRVLFAGMGSVVAAAVGAALFAVHPIHSESVAWGAGRSDVIACGFSVAAVMAYLHTAWSPLRRALIPSLLVFLAMLAKETAVAVLAAFPAVELLLRPAQPDAQSIGRAARRRQRAPVPARWRPWTAYAPFAAAFVMYAGLRGATIGSLLGPNSPALHDVPARVVAAVGVYLGKLLLPIRQCAYISDLPTGALGLAVAVVLASAVLGGCVLSYVRQQRVVTFLLAWIAVTLAPSLLIVVKIPGAPVAERYLYIPSVGFCLLVGYGAARALAASRVAAARTAVWGAVGLSLAGGAMATVQRNAVWRSNLSLWEDTAAKNASDGLPMRSLATAYQQAGDVAKAAEYFQLALQRRNDQLGLYTIYNNLGSMAMTSKQLDEAERHYQRALSFNPNSSECLYNLGLIDLTRATQAADGAQRRHYGERGHGFFERAARLSPLDPDVQVGLAQTLSALGDRAGARLHFERALQLGLPPGTDASVRRLLAEQ